MERASAAMVRGALPGARVRVVKWRETHILVGRQVGCNKVGAVCVRRAADTARRFKEIASHKRDMWGGRGVGYIYMMW